MSEKKQQSSSPKKPRLQEVPPVVIKGGSLEVQTKAQPFTITEFDDPATKTNLRVASHPNKAIKIIRVEIRDNRPTSNDDLLCLYAVPAELAGQVDINVFAK